MDETITVETAEQGSNAPARLCSVWIRGFGVHLRTWNLASSGAEKGLLQMFEADLNLAKV